MIGTLLEVERQWESPVDATEQVERPQAERHQPLQQHGQQQQAHSPTPENEAERNTDQHGKKKLACQQRVAEKRRREGRNRATHDFVGVLVADRVSDKGVYVVEKPGKPKKSEGGGENDDERAQQH